MKNALQVDPKSPQREVIERAAKILQSGGLVAFPTETVYGLGAHALDPKAARKIFVAKERPDWDPLIVHVSSVEMARTLATNLPRQFEELAERFWPGPLTMVVEKSASVPHEVTAGRLTVALRMPKHPVAVSLLAAARLPIAAPSANRFGAPSPTLAEHVLQDLGARVDLILDGGPTNIGVESTIIDLTSVPPTILRPGGVSREELGNLEVARAVTDDVVAKGLAAPGMSLKHYAPRARVETFETKAKLEARAVTLTREGRRVAAFTDPQAETLFAKLREFDTAGVEIILCLLPPSNGLGLAIRDRLTRAAGNVTVGGN